MMHSTNKGQLLIYQVLVQVYNKILNIISLDARSLALFRIMISLTTITDVMTRFPDAHHHYSDAGMFPREFIMRSFTNYYWITVHMISGSELVMQALFLLEIFIACLMLVGYRTRTMTILSWIMVCSVQNRNYILGHSGDTVHRLFLFWGIFLPLGRYFSVDRALEDASTPVHARAIAHEHDEDTHGNEKRRTAQSSSKYFVSNFATTVYVVQLLLMYYMAHHHKTSAEWREKGVAAWMALQLDYFRTWFGDLLLIWTPGVIFGNFAVLKWQHWGSLMYFTPFYNEYFKAFVCLGFFTMHAGFGMSFYLETFTWATISGVLGTIPAWVWDLAIKKVSALPPFSKPIQIHVTPGYPFGAKLAYCLDQFLLPGKSRVVFSKFQPTSQPCSCGSKCNWDDTRFFGIYITDSQKNVHHGPEVLNIISRSSPILYPLHFILRTQPARKAIHTLVRFFYHPSQHRYDEEAMEMESAHSVESKFSYRPYPNNSLAPNHSLTHTHTHTHSHTSPEAAVETSEFSGVVIDPDVPSRISGKKEFFAEQSGKFTLADVKEASKIGVRAAKEAFVAFLLVLIISCNWGNVNRAMGPPSALQPVLWMFQLDQYWGMFAPRPPDITWWYNFEGYLDDGTHVEIFNNGAMHKFTPNIPYTSEKPDIHESIGNHRWFKLFENGINSHANREDIRLYFGRWFCREYNARNTGTKRLYKYSIHFVFERLDMAKMDGSRFPPARETIWNHLCYEK